MENIELKILDLAKAGIIDKNLEHCFLVGSNVNGRKIEVFIDADEGVHFSDCRKLSRFIEERLDESSQIDKNYILEVSSPGVDRPLIFFRQYPKHIGRKIKVTLKDNRIIEGLLKKAQSEIIEIEVTKKKESHIETIQFDDISESKILITFHK